MSHLVLAKIECLESSGNYGKFTAEPLERGFGVTLGNALRRLLLNSLLGVAVTRVKIEGASSQFSTIPHMKEDITDFLLNVKALRLRSITKSPGKLFLVVEGEGIVYAADIKPSAEFDIINPEWYLATLDSSEAKLQVEFNVEQGKGFVQADDSDGILGGAFPVDAIFTPVRKVNYRVESARGGQQVSHERLIIEIWTDGAISSTEALAQSAQLLVEQFSPFTSIALPPGEEEISLPIPAGYDLPIEQLGLSARTLNSLRRSKISKVGELLGMSGKELLSIKKFGRKSLVEVQRRLEELGLPLLSDVEEKSTELKDEPEEEEGFSEIENEEESTEEL